MWKRFVRPQDLVWLALFSALAFVSPGQTSAEIEMLFALALLQVLEPRIPALNTPQGTVASILLKVVLGYLLIGVTSGITSSYYIILLLPVVSAATTQGPVGTLLFTLLACFSYLSFLLFVPQPIDPAFLREIILRVIFLPVVGFLTRELAEANRVEALRYQALAHQLADANSHLREAEAAVRRSDRLAALGQLTAGLAHELRNPLGTIKASSEMLARKLPDGDELAKELSGFIVSEVDRTNNLITRFLQFARPVTIHMEPADLAEIIDRAVTQIGHHYPPFNVAVYKNYSPDIPLIPMDSELMERVVFNLILNACQASPPNGAVTVKTRRLDDCVEVAVIDRGTGIAPKDRESIFNPFFTTKPEGVGLGLAIVAKIVDEHRGTIAVESEPGRGSVFRLYLPADAKNTAGEKSEKTANKDENLTS